MLSTDSYLLTYWLNIMHNKRSSAEQISSIQYLFLADFHQYAFELIEAVVDALSSSLLHHRLVRLFNTTKNNIAFRISFSHLFHSIFIWSANHRPKSCTVLRQLDPLLRFGQATDIPTFKTAICVSIRRMSYDYGIALFAFLNNARKRHRIVLNAQANNVPA